MRSAYPCPMAGLVCLVVALFLQVNPAVCQNEIGRGQAGRSDVATFVLTSGETFEDVVYEVNERFKTIKLVLAEGARQVSFASIESIAIDGQDVTERIIGRRTGTAGAPPADQQVWISATDEAYRTDQGPAWPLALRAAGNFSVPLGAYYDDVVGGIGYEGDLLVGLRRDIALRLSVSRSGVDFGDDLRFDSLDPNLQILEQNLSLAISRFSVAAQVHRPLSKHNPDGSLAYLYGGIGVAVHDLSAEMTWRDVGEDTVYRGSATGNQTKFMTTLGAGLTKMIGRQIGVDLSAEIDVIFVGTSDIDYYGVADTALLFDGRLGLVYLFN